jgi:hypothetical protein
MTPAALIGLIVAVGSAESPAPPVDKISCVAAHEAAQEFRRRNLLAQSRERLLFCSDPGCPLPIVEECRILMVDLDRYDPAGDGAQLLPGPSDGEQAAVQDRVVTAPPAAVPTTISPAAGAPFDVGGGKAPTRGTRTGTPSRAALVPGGLAVAALTTAAVFGWRGLSQADALRRTCSPDCDPSQVSPIRRQLLIADLSLLAGVGLGAVTALMIWGGRAGADGPAPTASSKPPGQPVPGAADAQLLVAPGLDSLQVAYGGRF